jgi:hypothetical protein
MHLPSSITDYRITNDKNDSGCLIPISTLLMA